MVEKDIKVRGLVRNDAKDGVKWRALSWGTKGKLSHSGKNGPKMFVVCCCTIRIKCTKFSTKLIKNINNYDNYNIKNII